VTSRLHGQLDLFSDVHYTAPLYSGAEAARIIAVPRGTLRNWAVGYASKRLDGTSVPVEPLVTTNEPTTPRGPTIPFVGLAEAFILAAFRETGVPMQRIRPAIRRLQEDMGLRQALASERLKTDGAELLWDYARRTHDTDTVEGLVVIRNGQQVFRPVVQGYLRRVTYDSGWARVINVGQDKVDVTVDPWINGGKPTLARRGIAVRDILSRLRAGESESTVAADYGLRVGEVTALLELAA
jgi:uncharacterized protein (DUF433 family)